MAPGRYALASPSSSALEAALAAAVAASACHGGIPEGDEYQLRDLEGPEELSHSASSPSLSRGNSGGGAVGCVFALTLQTASGQALQDVELHLEKDVLGTRKMIPRQWRPVAGPPVPYSLRVEVSMGGMAVVLLGVFLRLLVASRGVVVLPVLLSSSHSRMAWLPLFSSLSLMQISVCLPS